MSKVCPKCDSEMRLEDDSFDYGSGHHGCSGTEIIKYWICDECEHDEDYEGDDYDE